MEKSKWNINHISDLKDTVIVITGASSGLGKEATKILSKKNANLIMAVRNIKKAEQVASEIKKQHPDAKLDIRALELASLESVRRFTDGVLANYNRLDILLNNAGVMACPYAKTQDGFEIQMGINHLGHFALTGLLMPLLQSTKNARIIATSSIGHRMGNIDFSDFNWEGRVYKPNQAYADSKLANLYFAYELSQKLGDNKSGLKVTAAHPGWTRTDLQKYTWYMRALNPLFSQGPDQGVLPTLRAAFDSNANSGDYFGPSRFFEMHGNPIVVKSNEKSHDEKSAKQLWEISEQLTKVSY